MPKAVDGGYVNVAALGISAELAKQLARRLAAYEEAHFHQFEDKEIVGALDREAVEICRMLQDELPKIDYYSAAEMRTLPLRQCSIRAAMTKEFDNRVIGHHAEAEHEESTRAALSARRADRCRTSPWPNSRSQKVAS